MHELHVRRGVRDIRSALGHLGGSIVFDHRDAGGRDCYRLTLLGILLTADGPAIEQLLERHAAGRPLSPAEADMLPHVVAEADWLRDSAVLATPDFGAYVAARALDTYNPELPIDGVR
jgi:hypothetical protein